jgi:hypothetical protein
MFLSKIHNSLVKLQDHINNLDREVLILFGFYEIGYCIFLINRPFE